MVELQIDSHTFQINLGRVVRGTRHYADEVKAISQGKDIGSPSAGDPDMVIANKLINQHGGKILLHDYTDWRPDCQY